MALDLSGYLTDVEVNGTSVVNNGVASIPIATFNNVGVIKIGSGLGISNENTINVTPADANTIKQGSDNARFIPAKRTHTSTFYGLAKAAGDTTQAQSDNAVGTYTDDAKSAIRNMIGAAGTGDIPNVPVTDVQVNGTSVLNNGVAEIPVAGENTLGVITIESPSTSGLTVDSSTKGLRIASASANVVKTGSSSRYSITPSNQDASVFYGLTKAAGVDMASSNNAVGTYTD